VNVYSDLGRTFSPATSLPFFWDRICTVVVKFGRVEATGPWIITCPVSEPDWCEHADNANTLTTPVSKSNMWDCAFCRVD